MAKEIQAEVKLYIRAGQASPAPPIGPALSSYGIDLKAFCDRFNEATKDGQGIVTPVVLTIYEDRSFDFITKTPPVGELIKKELNLKKGSDRPNTEKVGKLTDQQLENIAKIKMEDLNTDDIEKAKEIIKGTAQQMGIEY
jgi:large subunit ribosomal protein L11